MNSDCAADRLHNDSGSSPERVPIFVCKVAEIPPGDRKLITVQGRSIGIFNIDGRLYALKNQCPHQGGPVCEGILGGTTLPSHTVGEFQMGYFGQVLRCPWHGWEFDVKTGRILFTGTRERLRTFTVTYGAEPDNSSDSPSIETFRLSDRDLNIYIHL